MEFLVQLILLLLAARLSHCIDADSRIITVGSDIELICSLPDVPHTSTWYFTPSDEVKSRELTTSHRVKIQSTSGVSQLSIEYVNKEDSGTYVCQVTATKTGETTSNDVFIIVTDSELADTTTWLPTLSSFETSELPWMPSESSTVEIPVSSSEIPEMSTDDSTLPFTDTSFYSSSTIIFDSTPVFDGQPDMPLNTPPVDLEVFALSDVDDDNSVEILVKWEPPYPEAPVDLYTIYYSTNKLAAQSEWVSAAVTESSLVSRVRIHPPTYFRVNAINSISQSPLSNTVMFFYQGESASLTDAGPSVQIDQVEPAVVSEAADETTTVDTETVTVNTKTTTVDTEETTADTEAATVDTKTTTVDTETATVNAKIATVDAKIATVNAETIMVEKETATVNTGTATVDRDAPTVAGNGTTLVINKYTSETATREPSFATDNSMELRGETGQPSIDTKSPSASTTSASSQTTLDPLNASANATSNSLSSQGVFFPAPFNFLVERNTVAMDRVVVDLSWESLSTQNVSSYIIRFTDSIAEADALWRVFSVKQTAYSLSLKISTTYYFKILAVSTSRIESQASPIYIYNSAEQKSRKCEDTECVSRSLCSKLRYGCCADGVTTATDSHRSNCPHQELCHVSQWGCCSDGVTAAAGPGLLGCAGDAQPCDISEHECCPDGLTPAAGPNFLGCDSRLEELTILTSLEGQGYNNCSGMSLNLLDDGCSRLFNSLSESCQLPSDSGTCTNYTVNWYYDVTSGSCRRFWYGGCGGNANRYISDEHCQAVCVDPSGLEYVVFIDYPVSITRGQGVGSQFSGSVGYDLVLPCDARGRPSPSVVWYKNRKPLAVNSETNKYFFSNSNFSLTQHNKSTLRNKILVRLSVGQRKISSY
ncbi:hypothetical protein EB796_001481 [Bugula neritina]|uniref:Papilin n=1 Tax=Bugula neritina TaxID=10212 RepID=A0A7J7KPT3_BUGNE|nr:hypothetical protein EB796_001481 [Bugula neritina]